MGLNLKDEKKWNRYKELNKDDFLSAICINVAQGVMEILDKNLTPLQNGYFPNVFTAHGIICEVADNIINGRITESMSDWIVCVVFECHKRGVEFKKSYNQKL